MRLLAVSKARGAAEVEAAHAAGLGESMSGDFETAIEERATIVRIGTAIFGPRPSRGAQ